MTTSMPEIVAAADWWASRLRGDRSWIDAGDPELTAEIKASVAVERKRTSTEVLAFRNALVPALEAHVVPHWDRAKDPQWASALRTVVVDYGPDPVLADAAESAGISRLKTGELPIKTVMWINPGLVTVREGYGGRQVLVWASPSWDRPACGKHRLVGDFRGWQVFNEICARPVYHKEDCGDWEPDTKRCATCGGTYVDHESEQAWATPSRCRNWSRENA